jgi:hypothetical protein
MEGVKECIWASSSRTKPTFIHDEDFGLFEQSSSKAKQLTLTLTEVATLDGNERVKITEHAFLHGLCLWLGREQVNLL